MPSYPEINSRFHQHLNIRIFIVLIELRVLIVLKHIIFPLYTAKLLSSMGYKLW